ncbi:NAD(P)-binding protein [Cubamyces sp. BRFM 1775]|nr:NAD(P)-binding protein [Cubamyces sp. BRFM 1775]
MMSAAIDAVLGREREFSAEDVPDLSGKTALITGATTGVGLEVAKVLASKKARVLILARHEDRPDEALGQIRAYSAETCGHGPDVVFVPCDLSHLEEVKRVGDEICERESRLDILVCDAGIGLQKFDVSEDGIDLHFAVTHLAHFLLINRLLPLLRRTAASSSSSSSPSTPSQSQLSNPTSTPTATPPRHPHTPRIVCITSTLHAAASPSVNFLSHAELTRESYAAPSPLALYARAKLATVLFVKFGLAPRLSLSPPPQQPGEHTGRPARPSRPSQAPILALATDPGPVHPGQPAQLANAYGPILGPAAELVAAPLERTPAAAARSTLWAATAPELELDSAQGEGEGQRQGGGGGEGGESGGPARWQGAYVVAPGRDGGESAMARDADLGARLWAMSEDLVRKRLGGDALRPWTWDG